MKKEHLKQYTALIWDNGNFLSFAQRLSREFGHVMFYSPWNCSPFPDSNAYLIGDGFDDVERVDSFFDSIELADIIIFLDTYQGDLQEYLVKQGHRVWGCRRGEELELDRLGTIDLMKKLGLLTPEVDKVIGLPKLREYLKEHEDIYVKVSMFRGDMETWGAKNYKLAEPMLDELEHRLGAKKLIAEFLCFKGIDAEVEAGLDIYTIDGEYPKIVPLGFEIKDCGFAATYSEYSKIPKVLTEFFDKMKPTFKFYKYRGDFSSESRITKDGESYMIDATCRKPSPPSELSQEMISNWGEIIWHGADGVLVEPEYTAKYGIEIIIKSYWAEKNWQAISYPDEIAQWVKLKNACMIKGQRYVIPQQIELCEIGAVVALGDTIEKAIDNVKEYISQVEGYGLNMQTESIIEKLNEQIDKGKKIGINF
jgi:hypothetical protein